MDIAHYANYIVEYRYLLLFPLMVIEGPGVTLLASVLAAQGVFDPLNIGITAVTANLTGDALGYSAGRFGGTPFIRKWGRFIRLKMTHIEAIERHFKKHAGKTIFLGKLTVGVGGLVPIAAGLAKYSKRRFFSYSLMAELPKTVLIILLGYYGAKSYGQLSHDFTLSGIFISLLSLALIAGLVYSSKRAKATIEEPLD